jgi:hypothetical protein
MLRLSGRRSPSFLRTCWQTDAEGGIDNTSNRLAYVLLGNGASPDSIAPQLPRRSELRIIRSNLCSILELMLFPSAIRDDCGF